MDFSHYEKSNTYYGGSEKKIGLNGHKSSYYEVISSLQYKECNIALANIYTKINLGQIFSFIDNDVLFIGNIQKSFYRHMIAERFNRIIKTSYYRLIGAKE